MHTSTTPTGRPLRVGLIGYGTAGRWFHAPLLSSVEGLVLAAVVTSSAERAEQARQDWPGVQVLPDVATLWDADVDTVVVASPNTSHVPLALEAVARGLPVVVDKPLATSAAPAAQLVETAAAAGVPLTVFQNRRWDSDVLTARALLAAGTLGEPLRLETRFERWRPQPRAGWREDPDAAGGLLLDLGVHQVDAALHLLGPVVHVHAELDRRRPGARVEDDVMLALTHAGGARSTHWLSATCALPGPRMRLMGSAAGLVVQDIDPQEAALRAGARPGPGWGAAPPVQVGTVEDVREVLAEPGDGAGFYRAWRDALREGAPVPVDPREAVHVLQVLDLARAGGGALG